MTEKKGLTYADAGVDLDKADELPEWIKPVVKRTWNKFWSGDIGGFSGTLSLFPFVQYQHPTAAFSVDGVGTKLKIAFMMDKHDTVGKDLVAMVVNDLIVNGSMPVIFLDYLATGKIGKEKIVEIVTGIGAACKEAGCALIGGETAEMPGFYSDDEYDLSGFGASIFDLSQEITGKNVVFGDQVIGLASSGLHSNGYALVRKICLEVLKLTVDSHVEELGTTLGEELLEPTKIYVKPILSLIRAVNVHGMVNITGGGIPDNFNRIMPADCCAVISKGMIPKLPIFSFLQKAGNVKDAEMFRTFNKGVGFSVIVSADDYGETIQVLKDAGANPFHMGEIVARGIDGESVKIL